MDTPILIVSPSSLKAWCRCKRQYFYKYVQRLDARMPGLPLKRGTWMHELLQWHYMGRDWRKAHRRLTKQFNNLMLEEREFYGDLPGEVERMMKAYLYHYRDVEADWEVLHVEETYAVEHPTGESMLEFKPDLIVYDKVRKITICWDHKTTKSIPEAEFRIQDLQSGLYPWGLKVSGMEVDAFGWNYIRTKPPTIPSVNQDGSISKRKIDTDFYTLGAFLKAYYDDTWPDIPENWKTRLATLKHSNQYFKRLSMVKSEALQSRLLAEMDYQVQEIDAYYELSEDAPDQDPWTRTMLKSCSWDCDFQELCIAELLGGDGRFIRKTKYKPSTYLEGRSVGRQ